MHVDELLDDHRYLDLEVTRCSGRTLHAVVDGEPVEVELPDDLAVEMHSIWQDDTHRLRIAQADPLSMPIPDGKGGTSHPETGWLVVSNPRIEARPVGLLAIAAIPAGYARGLTAEEIAHFPHLCRLIDDVTSDGGQSSSRNGATVTHFQVHHMAWPGGARALDGYSTMVATGSRQVSSNLGVGGGRLRRIVNLMRRAWTSGSPSRDATAITAETANLTGDPDWRVSEEDKNVLGRVAAALKLDLGWQSLVDRIYRHRDMYPRWGVSYPTACPVDITVDDIRRRAEGTTIAAAPAPPPAPEPVLSREDFDMRPLLVINKIRGHAQENLGWKFSIDGAREPIKKSEWDFWKAIGCESVEVRTAAQWRLIRSEAEGIERRRKG